MKLFINVSISFEKSLERVHKRVKNYAVNMEKVSSDECIIIIRYVSEQTEYRFSLKFFFWLSCLEMFDTGRKVI